MALSQLPTINYRLLTNFMSFTYKPKKKKRQRTHGFLARTATKGGQRAIAKRRAKGRKKLAV